MPIPYPEPPLAGTTFVLRPFREDDFDAALELGQGDAAGRWVPALPADDGAAVMDLYEEWRREGTLLHLVIADRASDAYLGEVTAALSDDRVGELGVGIVPAARGRGVATEAVRLLAEWALGTLRLGRLQVFIAPENLPALHVAESAGFLREGLLRSYWEGDGTRVDVLILSRLPGDAAEG